MGFGFYGRAFTFADPGYTKPCRKFKGASNPGPCTATGGYLTYYKIMNILNGKGLKERAIDKPIMDKESAVNYLTFGNDQ
jgi:chitinase